MLDLSQPVTVIWNGKQVHDGVTIPSCQGRPPLARVGTLWSQAPPEEATAA